MTSRRERTDEYGFELFEENQFPLAYLFTFRTFGTWLHGDDRGAMKRDGMNVYGTPRMRPNQNLESWMREEMGKPPFVLSPKMRIVVEASTREICKRRGYALLAVNVRTNHAHAVVSAGLKPERIADALKANATKVLREAGLISENDRVWSRGRSRRYLWKPRHVQSAIEYTQDRQGDKPFELDP